MENRKTILDEIISDWYEIRRGLIREIKIIPASRFNSFRATLETRSIIEIVQHVLEVSIMITEELLRDDTNFQRATFPQLLFIYAPNISRADNQEKLIDLLVDQFKDVDQRLHDKGDLFIHQFVTSYDGSKVSRLSLLQDALQHEMYHRGQLTVYERLLGLEPMSTKYSSSAIPRSPFSGQDL